MRMALPGRLLVLMAVLAVMVVEGRVKTARGRSPARLQGLLMKDGRPFFPIAVYEFPKSDSELKAMAAAGINLVRCGGKAALDRAAEAGLMGWIPVPMQLGSDEKLRTRVEAVKDHRALAVWEGPDEVVWNFTAERSRMLRLGIFKTPDDWWRQTAAVVEYSEAEGRKIIPKLREGAGLIRSLDRGRHPLWINEAAMSDLKFIRQYLDVIDITGCDIYPVTGKSRPLARVGDFTRRYQQVAKGKPVWMVLQGFSWNALPQFNRPEPAFPSFAESRMMAYDAIARGARGIFYWGTNYIPAELPQFRESLYALTRELAQLQPFLVSPDEAGAQLRLIESDGRPLPEDRGVAMTSRRAGGERLVVLVNEDARAHMGVEVSGLRELNDRELSLLYGTETVTVKGGEFITRLLAYEVKVFASSRKWESPQRAGRDFSQ